MDDWHNVDARGRKGFSSNVAVCSDVLFTNQAIQKVRCYNGSLRMRCEEDCVCLVKVIHPSNIGKETFIQSKKSQREQTLEKITPYLSTLRWMVPSPSKGILVIF
jgi:hypothetical protein